MSALRQLLCALAEKAGLRLATDIVSTPWHSATFAGERHVLTLQFTGGDAGEAVRRLLEGLDDHEFAVPGFLVADIVAGPVAAADGEVRVRLDVLLLDEG